MARARKPSSHAVATAPPAASDAPQARAPRRRWLFRLTAIGLGSIAALLIAEVALRALDIHPERHGPPNWLAWDGQQYVPMGGWDRGYYKRQSRFKHLGCEGGEHVPGTRFKQVFPTNPRGYFNADNAVEYTINSHGMRGPEITKQKPPGVFRILGVGDSFAFGQGVWEADTYLRRLEGSLNASGKLGQKVEVLNAGVQAYNTRDEAALLEFVWLDYQPDLVIVQYYLNDAYSEMQFATLIHGHLQTQPSRLAQLSYVCDLAESAWYTGQERQNIENFYRGQFFSQAGQFLNAPGEIKVDWGASKQALARIAEVCRARGIPVLLVMFPEFYQLDGDYPFTDVHRLVTSTARELGMATLDLLDVYRGHESSDYWAHAIDHHPNEKAHAEAAAAIERFLIEQNLLKPNPRGVSPAPPTAP